jgi:hypothetical protein
MCKKYKTRIKGKSWEKGRKTLCFRRKKRSTVDSQASTAYPCDANRMKMKTVEWWVE